MVFCWFLLFLFFFFFVLDLCFMSFFVLCLLLGILCEWLCFCGLVFVLSCVFMFV